MKEHITIKDNTVYLDFFGITPFPTAVNCYNWIDTLEHTLVHLGLHLPDYKYYISHKWENFSYFIEDDNRVFFKHLHDFCDRNNINPSDFTFANGNFKIWKHYDDWCEAENYTGTKITFECVVYFTEPYTENIFSDFINSGKQIEQVYCSLNRDMRRHRVSLFKRMYTRNLIDHGMVSFILPSKQGIYSEKLTTRQLSYLPITIDLPAADNRQEHLHNYIQNIHLKGEHPTYMPLFDRTFVSLITEGDYGILDPLPEVTTSNVNDIKTYQNGFVTEKTLRTFALGHPAVWLAAPYTLSFLKYMGFETFSKWWDESYDEILDPLERMDAVISIIEDLCKLSVDELTSLYNEMLPVLKHNHSLLFSMETPPVFTRSDWEIYSKDWKFSQPHY